MENRFLSRAKRKDNGEWITGYYVKGMDAYEKEVYLMFEPTTTFYSYGETDGFVEVDPSTICLCTGMDKNGRLIWENDIIKDLFSDTAAPIRYGNYQNCFDSTKAGHVGFYVDWSGKYTKNYRKDLGYWIHMVDAEIIGNAIDNPELLDSSHDGE